MNILNKIVKREINGRWFLGGSHVTLVAICIIFFSLQRTPLQIVFGLSCGLLTEIILYRITDKYKKSSVFDRLFSSFTEVSGLLVLLKSHLWWFYGVLGIITVVAKYLLRKTENTHIFNPTNFSIVMALVFFPLHWFAAWPDEYMRNWYPMLHVCAFGFIAAWLGKTWTISVAYIVSVIFCCFVFFPINNMATLIYALGPEFGAIGLIYLWQMITDPKTAPMKQGEQILFAFAIAFVHIFLRKNQFLYSRYIALFIVTLFYYLIGLYSTVQKIPEEA